MRYVLVAALVLSCSDYDLTQGNETQTVRPERGNPNNPESDTSVDSAGADETGSADTNIPDDFPAGKIDVVLLIDVAYFYDCYHADLALNTTALVDALLDSGADVAIGLASFDDYYVDGEWNTAWGGVPYTFGTQITTDRSRLHSAASTLELAWGGDGPGDGFEAIRQAGAGGGYDQDCNAKLDAATDIAPFNKAKTDAFGGKVAGLYASGVAGSGEEGGMGFRSGSKRVIVLVTENALRESKYGHKLPAGACPAAADRGDAVAAITSLGAKFLGVNAYEFWDEDTTPQDQLEALATNTNSKIDKDGGGKKDDLAVFGEDWNWPATALLVDAIWQLSEK